MSNTLAYFIRSSGLLEAMPDALVIINENGNIVVDNKCYDKDGNLQQSIGEAFVVNAPFNTKLSVSFLPEGVRWVPLARGDYWF